MTEDINFDGFAQRFRHRIYGNIKGELRLALVWQHMLECIFALQSDAPLSVWDAGGGLGQFSLRLAALGHRVLLSDISADMLAEAELTLAADPAAAERIERRCESIQSIAEKNADYDVIVCHAVLEWLAQPEATLAQLLSCLRPGGWLSLLVYNRNGLILTNLQKGNFRKLMRGELAGEAGGLTPPEPQDPVQVAQWVRAGGLEEVSRLGVRVAYELLRPELRAERSLDDLLAMERRYGAQEPFASLGRYFHLIARRPTGEISG